MKENLINNNTQTRQKNMLNLQAPTRNVIILGSVLIILQILDGILTNLGILEFGTSMEGNALLRNLMETHGVVFALVVSKLFAVSVIVALTFLAKEIKWIPVALTGVIFAYTTFAIVPWILLLKETI